MMLPDLFAQLIDTLPTLGVFDYAVVEDQLHMVSSYFRETGMQRQVEHFARDLGQHLWLSADSQKNLQSLLVQAIAAPTSGLVDYQGSYSGEPMHWYRMRYVSLAGAEGTVDRVIGVVFNIEEERQQLQTLREQATRDAMTGLLNHDTSSRRISRALISHGGGALMVLDVDDFKQINDTTGHQQGDLFLQRTAKEIRSLFRQGDILGRYGGDEFLVFLPGIQNVELIRQRAEQLLQRIAAIRVPVLENTSCSIGIAVAQSGDIAMTDLFKQADFALYEAKNSGKGHYVILVDGQPIHQQRALPQSSEPRASENQGYQLVGQIFGLLCNAQEPELAIWEALALVGRTLDLSRVYIFERLEHGEMLMRNTFEWCGQGILPEQDHLQCVDLTQPGLDFMAHYDANDSWFCPDVALLEKEQREFLQAQGIHSMLHWVFRRNGRVAGIVGFDECHPGRVWGTQYALLLRRVGMVIVQYLMQYREAGVLHGLSREALFQGLSNTSEHIYLFECDIKQDISQWSENATTYFGLPAGGVKNMVGHWLPHIHPDDRAGYQADLLAVFSGKKSRHHYQYRARNAQGSYVWVECSGTVLPGPDGELTFFVGIISRLDHQSQYDPTTACLSIQEFYAAELSGTRTLILLGMDEFRRVVNSLGYETGNEILITLAGVLRRMAPYQPLYRMTGDEFLVVLPCLECADVAQFFASALEQFQQACAQKGYWRGLSFSGGSTRYQPGPNSKNEAIQQLEHSMEYSKKRGKGQFTCFSNEIAQKHLRSQRVREALSRAIEHGFAGFELYYQPLWDTRTQSVYAVEGLLRFRDPELGMLSPAEVIPILEETGDILSVGDWVMRQAVRQKARWASRWPKLWVGFNVSYLQLCSPSFVEGLLTAIREQGVDPSCMIVELTESCLVQFPEELAAMLRRLKEHRVSVVLDDFGMEHSSFTLVRDLPVDGVKIDHSFVRKLNDGDAGQNRVNRAVISSINFMCKQLGLRVVAEGVETLEIAHMLEQMGIHRLQGYYFSRPVPVDQVEKLL